MDPTSAATPQTHIATTTASPIRTRVDMSMNALMASPVPSNSSSTPRTTSTTTSTTALPPCSYFQSAYGSPHLPPLQFPGGSAPPPVPAPLSRHSPELRRPSLPNTTSHHYYHHPQPHETTPLPPLARPHMAYPPPPPSPQNYQYPPPPPPPQQQVFTSMQQYPPANNTQQGYHPSKPQQQQQQQQQTRPVQQHHPHTPQNQNSPTSTPTPANQIPPGGAPARRYLNDKVTPVLLEGMKMLAREQPKEPLLALAKFLEERHRELVQKEDVKMEDANGVN